MNRRTMILEELQLTPVWIRRELLQIEEAAVLVAPPVNEVVPNLEPQSPHPLPAVARAANKVMAPLIALEVPRANKVAAAEASPLERSPEEEARLQSIAGMDWEQLQEAIAQCTACALCQTRRQAVAGAGSIRADLVVVGVAPGVDEDSLGEPFAGRAGKLLDNMLASIREKRGERVYMTNVLKCMPPGRNPLPNEIAHCAPFLLRQLELIAPKAILAAGHHAAHALLRNDAPILALRSKPWQWRTIPLQVTYHPTYLLRNLPDKAKAWEDLLRVRDMLDTQEKTATIPEA